MRRTITAALLAFVFGSMLGSMLPATAGDTPTLRQRVALLELHVKALCNYAAEDLDHPVRDVC